MFVTAELDLTLEQIEALNEEELMKIYYQRIEDWVIYPMQVLMEYENTGWAILQTFVMGAELLPFDGIAEGQYSHLLSKTTFFVTGDIEEAFKVNEDNVVINPYFLVNHLQKGIRDCKSKNWKPNLKKFKEILIIKAKACE